MPSIQPIRDSNKAGLGAGLQTLGQGLMQSAALFQRDKALADQEARTQQYAERERRLAMEDQMRAEAIRRAYGFLDGRTEKPARAAQVGGAALRGAGGVMGGALGAAMSGVGGGVEATGQMSERRQAMEVMALMAEHAPDQVGTFQRELKAQKEAERFKAESQAFARTAKRLLAYEVLDSQQFESLMGMAQDPDFGPTRARLAMMEMQKEASEARTEMMADMRSSALLQAAASDPQIQSLFPSIEADPLLGVKGQVGGAMGFLEWYAKNVDSKDPATREAFMGALEANYAIGKRLIDHSNELEGKLKQAERRAKDLEAEQAKAAAIRRGGAHAAAYMDTYGYDPEVAEAAGAADGAQPPARLDGSQPSVQEQLENQIRMTMEKGIAQLDGVTDPAERKRIEEEISQELEALGGEEAVMGIVGKGKPGQLTDEQAKELKEQGWR